MLTSFFGQDATPIEAAKARLDAAVKKFEESYSALVAPKGKSSPIPNITLQQIASSYEVTATNNDVSQRGDNFGKAVEQLLLASVQEEPLPKTELRKKTQAAKDSFSKGVSKVGDFVGKLLPLAIFACGVTSTLGDASLVAFPLKAIANGTALVLQLCQKEKDRGEEFISELDRISYQSRRVFEIQKQPRESLNPLLLEKSLDLMAEIINFLAASMKYLKHGFLLQVVKSLVLGPEIWQASIKNLHLAYEEYDQALLLQIASSIIYQQTQTREASLELKDDAFFEWLSPSVWEVEAQLLANRSQRADGTLGWVLELEEFRKWRVGNLENSRSTPAQTLWLNGLPGTGKSTISAYLYDLLLHQYPDATILHFFCKSGTPGLTTAHNIVRTLCYQLTQKDPFYQRYLQHKPDLPSTGRCENVVLLFNNLIKDPLSKGRQDSDTFILLDGLDELEDTSSQAGQPSYTSKTEIEALLEALVQIPRAKILVTSRSSPELKRILDEAGTTRTISWRDNTEDIKRYVKARVNRSPKLTNRFQQIGKDPVEFFEKANGIFLWAALVLDMLERTVSTNAFSVALEQVPPTMNNVYDQIIERTVRSGNYRWIKEILGWTLILPSPFAVQQMNMAVNLSLNDEMYNMEDFLRSECGSLLGLVPVLGSSQNFEIHIGHETFQAYLTNPANSHGDLFTSNIAHGKAALACLRYLIAEKPLSDEKFKLYAITRWRWHLRASMGIRERGFAEPLSALEGGKSLPDDLSQEIIVALYKFLTTSKVDPWLEYYFLEKRYWDKQLFKEVYHTCIELSAWYRVNKQDQTAFETHGISTESLISWCSGIPDLQYVADRLWPRACHVWLWNSWKACMPVICGYDRLVELDIWTNHPDIVVPSDEAIQLLKEEERIVEANEKDTQRSKSSGKLFGNLSLRYANFYLILQKERGSRKHLDAVTTAGEVDDMSGVCQANISVALNFLSGRVGFEQSNKEEVLSEAMTCIRNALAEDPDGNPRYYEHLGYLYHREGRKDDALEAWKTGLALDPDGETCCGEEYYQQKVWKLTRKDLGCTTPDFNGAIAVLEEAIKNDPGNANSRWFHQMASMYKEKGDLEGARRTYRANMEFDPSWNSQWEDLADAYIDKELFEETRQFNWRAYCSALTEATIFDPSGAHSHLNCWVKKAETLKGYQYFELAVEILEHGIETTSQMKTKAAIEARANFEFKLGETFCAMTRWEAAVSSLEDSFKHMPNTPETWQYNSLGDAYTSCGRYEEALALFNKMLEKDPSSSGDHASVAEIYVLSGTPTKALKEYQTAIRLQESFAVERAGWDSDYPTAFDQYVRDWYIDLGMAYERLSRQEQSLKCFQKALPHAEDQVNKQLVRHGEELAFEGDNLHRSEGRALMKLGWLYERLDPSDKRAEETYERAVWVFKTTVHAEDDFLEETECVEAEEALARVKRGEPWVFSGEEVDRELREQARARTYRMNWGVNLERRKKGTKQSMMRGH
jgi:pentatricopeptide repeat protein